MQDEQQIIVVREVNHVFPYLPILGETSILLALATLERAPSLWLLNPHAQYYVCEMRVMAYNQMLGGYWSVDG
jgi:hypothetical protein